MKIKYKYSKKAFSRWTKSSAYWAGFIMADGCIYDRDHRLSISLKNTDKSHVEKFAKFLKCDHPVKEYSFYCSSRDKRYNGAFIQITSIYLCNQLKLFGIGPRKSLTALWPKNIPSQYELSFLRGLFDGDGTICRYRPDRDYYKFSVIGTLDIVTNVRRVIEDILGESFGAICQAGKVWRYQINSTKQVIRIGDALYKGTLDAFRLERKYNLYQEIQSLKRASSPLTGT